MSLTERIRAAQVNAGEMAVIQDLHDRGICSGNCPICAEAGNPKLNWIAIADRLPPERQLVLVKGPSGYVTHTEFQISAYYDNSYRPPINGRTRWLDPTGTDLSDHGWEPTHWRELL